jgi:hypothetical protein
MNCPESGISRSTRHGVRALTRTVKAGLRVFIVSLVASGSVLSCGAAVALPQDRREQDQRGGCRAASPGARLLIMKTADLVKLARIKTMAIVSEQSRQSFPVPVMCNDGLHILFFYYPALAIPRQPSKIGPPAYLLSLQANSKFDELRAVTAKDFNQSHRADEIIGTYGLPEGLTLELYYQKLARLNEVYDVLIPEFGGGRSGVSQEIMSAAKEFRELFDLLSEAPLKPYYDFVEGDFFAWLDQVSEPRSRGQDPGRGHHSENPSVLENSAPRTGPVAMGPRSIEDDIGISEEKKHVVERITEDPGNGRYGIGFRHLAAIYFLRKDSPKSSDWLALLKRSLSEGTPVNFHHVVGWQQITYVELAQMQGSRSFGDQLQETSASRMREGPIDRGPNRE